LSQKKKDFKKSLGLHSNFKNLKPHYDNLKYGRAKDLANFWLRQIGDKLTVMTLEEARKNF